MRTQRIAWRAWAVGLVVFASPPAGAVLPSGNDAPVSGNDRSPSGNGEPASGNDAVTTKAENHAAAEVQVASTAGTIEGDVELAQALPVPKMDRQGAVPLSEPIAPVPPGQPTWSLVASAMAGLGDAFYSKAVVQASVRRGFGWWSVEAFGGPSFSWEGPALDLCKQPGQCTTPTGQQLGAVPGQLTWMAGAGAVGRLGLGKISFAGLPATGFSLEAGAAPMAIGYRLDIGGTQYKTAPGGRVGLALGVDLTRDLGLRFDWQGLGYLPNIRGSTSFETQMLAGVGFDWRPGVGP